MNVRPEILRCPLCHTVLELVPIGSEYSYTSVCPECGVALSYPKRSVPKPPEPRITIREMREFVEQDMTWLRRFVACPERAASEKAYCRVLAYLDQREKEVRP